MTRGLYDGFEGFRTATTDEQRTAVAEWLVVLDTNVLLNLYAYQGSALDDFINVFQALGQRLFIPHQVMDEFWRNRRTVLKGNKGKHRERETAEESFDAIEQALRRWHQRVVDRAGRPAAEVTEKVATARAAVLDLMDRVNAEAGIVQPDTPTYDDRVLARLDTLLQGRVGEVPSDAERQAREVEGRKRVTLRVPPGYLDGDKNPERAIGDYLVWRQTMDESARLTMPVLLITQDQKEDWWADRGTESMRARPELVAELLEVSGQRLLMMRAHDLVGMGDVLGVEVSRATVEEAEEASQESNEDVVPELSGTRLLYRQFWTLFEPLAKERGWTRAAPPAANWWSMPAGGGGNVWSTSWANFGARVELYLGNGDAEVNLHRLRALEHQAEAIKAAFGDDDVVHFNDLPHAQACRVEIRLEDGRSINDQGRWEDTIEWMVDRQERLRAAIEAVGGVPMSVPS